jgi:hypothetical protein
MGLVDWHCWRFTVTSLSVLADENYGNKCMFFTVGQKLHKNSDVPMQIRACILLSSKNVLKALLA